MSLIKELNEAAKGKTFSAQQTKDMNRLVDQYVEAGHKEGTIRDLAGDDLEMLEYDPKQVAAMVPEIVQRFKQQAKKK